MTVLGALRARAPMSSFPVRRFTRALLTAILRRLADCPLDSTVLQALGSPSATRSPATGCRTVQMHATWQTIIGPDGASRLEARWDAAP
ncbi:hypothetical protein [Kitasatospora sp. MAP5-34]|uniref:hypothetical protein n=1 Tax=Kitasatospora sp. MAP5-34 TaxID=3035102 RepID=UPI0024748255|nr:hypothetical protein [Kitasatospora sp. MAP5-34]MDH6574736.1 hypothetical protein [Kitasatospora sp. MAP5-34]